MWTSLIGRVREGCPGCIVCQSTLIIAKDICKQSWPLKTGTPPWAGTLIGLHLFGQTRGRQNRKSIRKCYGCDIYKWCASPQSFRPEIWVDPRTMINVFCCQFWCSYLALPNSAWVGCLMCWWHTPDPSLVGCSLLSPATNSRNRGVSKGDSEDNFRHC